MSKLLFLLKKRQVYGEYSYSGLSSGLQNSVKFTIEMLTKLGIEAKMVELDDNNQIDREVALYRPTHVIIEAYWVVPEKFDVLKPLHPGVHWIVRNHSETPFLANEGPAFGWTCGYLQRGVEVMCNSPRARQDMRTIAKGLGVSDHLCTYGPNWYPITDPAPGQSTHYQLAQIACFGAIRPLKNHMVQAIAALHFANINDVRIAFNINSSRPEGGGDPILRNLRSLFAAMPQHQLIEHPWLDHDAFLELMADMQISLQVSFSETFNIVSADAVACEVPIVVSREVPFAGRYAIANPERSESIAHVMSDIWKEHFHQHDARIKAQKWDLLEYDLKSEAVWKHRFA